MNVYQQQELLVVKATVNIIELERLLGGTQFPFRQTYLYAGRVLSSTPMPRTREPTVSEKSISFGWWGKEGNWVLYAQEGRGGFWKPLKEAPAHHKILFIQRIEPFTKSLDKHLSEINRSAGAGVDYLTKYLKGED